MCTVDLSFVELEWSPTGKGDRGKLTARTDGVILHADQITLASASNRARFLKELARKFPGMDSSEVEDEMLKLVEQIKPDGLPRSIHDSEPLYESVDHRLYKRVLAPNGGVTNVILANFEAEISREIIRDDGVEQSRKFVLEGTHESGEPLGAIEVPTEEFTKMDWLIPKWGSQAVLHAGPGNKDHLRAAIQLRSAAAEIETVYGHTGWRQIDGTWAYLHAGGAIGPDGSIASVGVDLEGPLKTYHLDVPLDQNELVQAVRTSFELLDGLAADRVVFPLLSTVYRAILPDNNFSTFIVGQTGSLKSELAALCQQHWGPGFLRTNLPASWSSTDNALEALAFQTKDALIVIDDYKPMESATYNARLEQKAERVLRAQGNHSGRQRLRPDGTSRPVKPPRGLILCTGEDLPRGHSILARLLIINVGKDDVDLRALTRCQAEAKAGTYARAMAGFIQWFAGQYESITRSVEADFVQIRSDVARSLSGKNHRRTPELIADLLVAFRLLMRFATAIKAIDRDRADYLEEKCWNSLIDLAGEQSAQQGDTNPCEKYMEIIQSGLMSGSFHLTDSEGKAPVPYADALGWRHQAGHPLGPEWQPQGKRIGYYIDGDVWLDPGSTYTETSRIASQRSDGIGLTKSTLNKRLKDGGFLASWDEARDKIPVRKLTASGRPALLHFSGTRFIDLATEEAVEVEMPPGLLAESNGPEF